MPMTGLERTLKALNREVTDRMPLVPENYNFCIHYSGHKMKDVCRDGRLLAESLIRTWKDFVLFDGDCAFKTALMIKPGMFRKLVYDRTKITVSHLQKLNIPYTFHSDGKMDEFVPLLIELGFSAVHGCEKVANDLGRLVDRFGDDICLAGNMDVVFLSKDSVREIRDETERMLEIGSQKGRFMAACNTSPQDYIPDENYKVFTETIKQFNSQIEKGEKCNVL